MRVITVALATLALSATSVAFAQSGGQVTATTAPAASSETRFPLPHVSRPKQWVKVPLKNVKPTELVRRLRQQEKTQPGLLAGIEQVLTVDVDNSVLVQTTAKDLSPIRALITRFDAAKDQSGSGTEKPKTP